MPLISYCSFCHISNYISEVQYRSVARETGAGTKAEDICQASVLGLFGFHFPPLQYGVVTARGRGGNRASYQCGNWILVIPSQTILQTLSQACWGGKMACLQPGMLPCVSLIPNHPALLGDQSLRHFSNQTFHSPLTPGVICWTLGGQGHWQGWGVWHQGVSGAARCGIGASAGLGGIGGISSMSRGQPVWHWGGEWKGEFVFFI